MAEELRVCRARPAECRSAVMLLSISLSCWIRSAVVKGVKVVGSSPAVGTDMSYKIDYLEVLQKCGCMLYDAISSVLLSAQ